MRRRFKRKKSIVVLAFVCCEMIERSKKECCVATKEEVKVGFFQRATDGVRRYVNETVGELRKVTWPTRKEATNLTVIVLIVLVVMSSYLGLMDFIFSQFMALLFSAG
jgi:preprotein translocase subunit SecE